MKKISIIIVLYIIGCAGNQGNKRAGIDTQKKSKINIYSQHWNISEDSLNLFLHFELPLNHFVFKKSPENFYSDINFTLVISDTEQNTQMYRESWNEKVTQTYYSDTRNPEKYFTTERNIALIPGNFKVFLNIQDADSRRNWQINKEYKLERIGALGPSLLFINDGFNILYEDQNNVESQKSFAVVIREKIDTLWLRTQVYLVDSLSNQIDFSVIYKETVIDSGLINITGIGINYLYYLPIPMIQHKRGRYEITLSFQGEKQTVSFSYRIKGKRYWTDDLDEVVGVMQYMHIAHSDYKKLQDMDESSQWNYIDEYWKEKDPSPETEGNELLIQLNNRVEFVNKKFSIIIPGWKSDRGRIYIIYGKPKYDESYQDQMGYTYQKWVYSSGKQFIFIDRSMSGDYSLFREMY